MAWTSDDENLIKLCTHRQPPAQDLEPQAFNVFTAEVYT